LAVLKNPSLAIQTGALDGAIGALCDPKGNAQNFRANDIEQ
jgi:hypothetical protein